MRLDRLASSFACEELRGDPGATEIRSVVSDSRDAGPGALFCCVKGRRHDGHEFAADAVSLGAAALLVERLLPLDVAQVRVRPGCARRAMGQAAAELYGQPSRSLRTVGVTGTNGKTTVTYMLRSIFEAHGWPTTVIGTISGGLTTPEAPVLERLLSEHRDAGGTAAVMEVSSHALEQGRVEGVHFSAVAFTNLSQEHLDYHRTMRAYFEAKAILFEPGRSDLGVVNADDPWGRELLARGGKCLIPYGIGDATDIVVGQGSTAFRWHGQRVTLASPGRFNVYNALAAATVAEQLGVPAATVAEGLSRTGIVPGRMEPVEGGQGFSVFVDYAHTPSALEEAMAAARTCTETKAPGGFSPRLIVVFGCGGDRDREKRPAMGRIAGKAAELVVVTSDNPRSEDSAMIVSQVLSGVPRGRPVAVEIDRRAAIERALAEARPGDVVLVAGRGHETTQKLFGRELELDDREVVRSSLAPLGAGSR